MVSIFFPWQATARVKQELTTRPSIITLQAPQTPMLQPSLVPVRPMSSRRACRSNRLASSCRSYSSPLTSSRICFFMMWQHIFCLCDIQLIECNEDFPFHVLIPPTGDSSLRPGHFYSSSERLRSSLTQSVKTPERKSDVKNSDYRRAVIRS